MIGRRAIATFVLTLASFAVSAADNYTFDSVSAFDFNPKAPTITGILKNTASPITITFPSSASGGGYRETLAYCMPVILTAMEKPGRYFLNFSYDPGNSGPIRCGLELRD
jgi:hypothetical protein